MLSREDNELLVRTGPGTPMGTFCRRFWAPVMLEDELGGPDSAPVRVNVLGEKLVAFRDSSGTIGLLDAYCPHRRANLYWGRNERNGLRCLYHGWKFDAGGQCTDMPNCSEGVTLKDRVKTRAYPTLARGGIVWAYMGPSDRMPEFPNVEILSFPSSHRHIAKIVLNANYFQLQEGDMDSSHTSFLHSRLDKKTYAGGLATSAVFQDTAPRWSVDETKYGLMLASQRAAGEDQYNWRVGQYLMPYIFLIAAQHGTLMRANIRIPIDDEHSILFRAFVRAEQPLNDDDRAAIAAGVMTPEMIPGTFSMKENLQNEYLIDRERQRVETFSGIKSIVAQDVAVTEDQGGPVADRSLEYLVSSDRAITALRKKLLTSVKGLMQGIEPPELANPKAYGVRAVDFLLPRDVSIHDGAKDLLLAGAG
jgi:phthalate 4,5-dioxygenase